MQRTTWVWIKKIIKSLHHDCSISVRYCLAATFKMKMISTYLEGVIRKQQKAPIKKHKSYFI